MSKADGNVAYLGDPAAQPTRDAGRRRRLPRLAQPGLVLCCYLLGAVALTAHLWVDPASREQLSGGRDVDLFAWFLRYAATAVAHGHLPSLFTVAMNAPQGVNLMWNTSFLLPGVLLAPVTLLAGPQVSLTLALTLGFAGSAASLFWVLRRWGASVSAAALSGAVYGFSPAMLNAGFAHYHLQFAVLPPLIIDAALWIVTTRGRSIRGGIWLGLLCAAQLFTGEELLVYTAITGLILVVVVVASHPREVGKRVRAAATGLAVALAVFLLVDGRALWEQFAGPLAEHAKLGTSRVTTPSWFVTPSAALLFHTRGSAAVTPPIVNPHSEDLVYLGWPLLIVLVIAAVVFWRDARVRAVAVTWAVLDLCALGGGDLTVGSFTWPGRLLPWHWLQGLPGLAQVLPGRFSILADGAAAALLAFALDRARAATRQAEDSPRWPRVILTGVALLAVLPLTPLPYQATPVPRVPAGWQATFTGLQLPSDAPVLVLPFPSDSHSEVLRWQADTGWPESMVGGYFLGPNSSDQPVFYFSNHNDQTDVARYLLALWEGRRVRSPSISEIRAVFAYWRPAAIVVVASPQSPAVRVLTQLFGQPTSHVGEVFSWRCSGTC
ncbi:MAG TPA: hypothetical protein VMU95_32955 [Trebonia sp.]|nr:hypothetical protein [Trebonia sp.]